MTRRYGMTTQPAKRKQNWKGKKKIKNWQIVKRGLTYKQAQATEKQLGRCRGAESKPGGRKVSGRKWSVYRFDY